MELLRRNFQVFVGKHNKKEVDFVAIKGNTREYYQVSASVLENMTLKRELASLKAINNDNYSKYLLTLDEIGKDRNFEGIKQINALEWLLNK